MIGKVVVFITVSAVLVAVTALPLAQERTLERLMKSNRVRRQIGYAQEEAPTPYLFNSESQDPESGTTTSRQESGDQSGVITGSYSIQDPKTGLYRVVTYTADPVNGFTAQIQTNEPGTKTSQPAGADYQSSAPQQ